MAVIVRHKEFGARYILLGAGFGAYKSSRPGLLLGNWAPHEKSGDIRVVLVCDSAGVTNWVESVNLEVVSVDGAEPAAILGGDA